jgi:hypothetical protein
VILLAITESETQDVRHSLHSLLQTLPKNGLMMYRTNVSGQNDLEGAGLTFTFCRAAGYWQVRLPPTCAPKVLHSVGNARGLKLKPQKAAKQLSAGIDLLQRSLLVPVRPGHSQWSSTQHFNDAAERGRALFLLHSSSSC